MQREPQMRGTHTLEHARICALIYASSVKELTRMSVIGAVKSVRNFSSVNLILILFDSISCILHARVTWFVGGGLAQPRALSIIRCPLGWPVQYSSLAGSCSALTHSHLAGASTCSICIPGTYSSGLIGCCFCHGSSFLE